MLDNVTKRRIDTARDILVGKVPDPKSQVEQITIALIYKFMDDMDAEAEALGGKRSFFVGEYEKYGWARLMQTGRGGYEVLALYGEAITKMTENEGLPLLFRDIFKNAYLPYRDPETLKSFLKIIDEFNYDHSEKLGDAFEYLLSVLGSQGDAGQFRTPRHIIDFMVQVIDPQKGESILDPACGTAGFLISAYKHILNQNARDGVPGRALTPDERKRLIERVKGYDISPDMVRLSLVNLYLHGFNSPLIFEYDTLTSEERWNEYFDVVMANPPFMSPKGGIKPHNRFSVQSSRSEVLFVDYIAEHLSPNGRAAVIVPEGVIFQSSNAYKKLRKMLVEDNSLVGVISLPAGVFNPYSGVKTSILWLDKALAKQTDQIAFIKIENDGFDLGAQRREIKRNDLPRAIEAINEFKNSVVNGTKFDAEKYECLTLVNIKDIGQSGEFNLSGERYKQSQAIDSDFPVVEISEVAEVIAGQSPSSEFYNEVGEGLPFYQGKTEFEEIFIGKPTKWTTQVTKEAIAGDILMSVRAPVGPVNIATEHICIGRGLAAIRPKKEVLPMYLFYLLRSQEENITGDSGAVFANISRKQIEKIKIPLPPLEVQEEIVAEIEGYQKIIDGARQVVENYRPRIPIDPDWPVVDLGDHIKFVSGLTLSIPQSEKVGGTPIVSINNVTESGELVKDGLREVEIPRKKTVNYLQKGDLLFNWRNGSKRLVGKTGYFDWEGEYVFASFLLGIRPKKKSFTPKFLWILLNQYRVEEKYMSFMRQNVNGLFNREELKILKVPLPDIESQKCIVFEIEKEQKLVEASTQLIIHFEQKIKERIARVWGEE